MAGCAQEIIDGGLNGDKDQLLAAAEGKLGRARTLIDEVGESLKTTAELGDLPEFEPPEPAVPVGMPCQAELARPWSAASGSSPSSAGR